MKEKNNLVVGLFLGMSILLLMGARLAGDNSVYFGDTTTAVKDMIFGDENSTTYGIIRFDPVNQNFTQSVDNGANFLGLGSGGGGAGGGINELQTQGLNHDFESGVNKWTNTGSGTFIELTAPADVFLGKKSVRFDAAAASDEVISTTVITSNAVLDGSGCDGEIAYKGGDANYKLQVIGDPDGSPIILSEVDLVARTTWGKVRVPPFQCAAEMALKVIASADGAQIDLDEAYLGSSLGLGTLGTIELAGVSVFPPATNCTWSLTGATLTAFTADPDCVGPTIIEQNIGEWQTTDSDLPRQTINNLPAGKYIASFIAHTTTNGGAGSAGLSITDGTTTCDVTGGGPSASSIPSTSLVECVFNYTDSGNRTFELLGNTSAFTYFISNNTTTGVNLRFSLTRYPLEGQKTFTAETQNYYREVSITGSNISMAAGDDIPDTTDLVLTNEVGSGCFIPCAGTEVASGTTCSANEQLGVACELPSAGEYEVCADFTNNVNSGTGGSGGTAQSKWKLSKYNNADDTDIVEDKVYSQGSYMANGSIAGTHNTTAAISICERFTANGTGLHTFRLQANTVLSGGGASSIVYTADTTGIPKVKLKVKKVGQNVPAPILVGGSVFVDGANQKRIKMYQLAFGSTGDLDGRCVSSPCEILVNRGDWYSGNVIRFSVGRYDLISDAVFKPNEYVHCDFECSLPATNACNVETYSLTSGVRPLFQADGTGVLTLRLDTKIQTSGVADTYVSLTCYSEE